MGATPKDPDPPHPEPAAEPPRPRPDAARVGADDESPPTDPHGFPALSPRGESGVGRTGARFGPLGSNSGKHNASGLRWEYGQSDEPEPRQQDEFARREPGIGLTGARFGPHSERRRRREEDGVLPEVPEVDRGREWAEVDREPLPSESDVLIRPYARTGGRTRPVGHLALESLISTVPRALGGQRSWEHRRIASLCVRPRSVAEVAALLAIPLGVARILLGDMAADGAVVVHGGAGNGMPDLVLMHRVLAGLRRL